MQSVSPIRYPQPLRPGNVIGVTAPSAGIDETMRARFEFCKVTLEARGYEVRVGECLYSDDIVSAPATKRADELMRMLLDPSVALVMPPWGGELLINILPHLDFERLASAPPKWFAGWSDGSVFTLPLAIHTGGASVHGMNFMDSAFAPARGVAAWWDVVGLEPGGSFEQRSLAAHQRGFKDYVAFPDVTQWEPDVASRWQVLGADRPIEVSGRMVGGCIDVLSKLVGTRYGDIDRFARERAPEGLIIYLENCESKAADACRSLHQFRLADWFKHANAILIGRTKAEPTGAFTQVDAIADALGGLNVPVLYDVDISHVPPQLMVVNGALGAVRYEAGGQATLTQTFG